MKNSSIWLSVFAAACFVFGGVAAVNGDDDDNDKKRRRHRSTKFGQSPIDITPDCLAKKKLQKLNFRYKRGAVLEEVCLEVANGELDDATDLKEAIPEVKATVKSNRGLLRIGRDAYRLNSFHWHTPSEHIVDGQAAAMELHLVHENVRTGTPLVVGVLYVPGERNDAIDPIFSRLDTFEDEACFEVDRFNLNALLPPKKLRTSFRYGGSFTTSNADCEFTEGVRWVVLTEPVTASPEQIAAHMQLVDEDLDELEFEGKDEFDFERVNPIGNARLVQAKAGRKVLTDLGRRKRRQGDDDDRDDDDD